MLRILVVILVLQLSATPARASISSTVTIGVLLDQLETSINGVIDTSRNAGDALLFNAASQMLSIIYSLRSVLDDQREKLFRDLDVQQQKAFRDLDDFLTKFQSGVKANLDQVENISYVFSQALAGIIGNRKDPLIFKIENPVNYPLGNSRPYELKVRGTFLKSGSLELHLEGASIERSKTIDIEDYDKFTERQQWMYSQLGIGRPVHNSATEAFFVIPADKLKPNEATTRTIKGAIVAKYKSGFWKTDKTDTYLFYIMIMPEKVATVTVAGSTRKREREYLGVSTREFSHSGDNCRVFSQGPVNDYQIDVATVTDISVWGEAGSWELTSNSPGGFQVELCAKRMCCARIGPGNQHVIMQWDQYKEVEKTREFRLQPTVIKWGSSVALPLPEAVQSLLSYVTYDLGQTEIINDRGRSRSGNLQVSYSSDRRMVIIEPILPPWAMTYHGEGSSGPRSQSSSATSDLKSQMKRRELELRDPPREDFRGARVKQLEKFQIEKDASKALVR